MDQAPQLLMRGPSQPDHSCLPLSLIVTIPHIHPLNPLIISCWSCPYSRNTSTPVCLMNCSNLASQLKGHLWAPHLNWWCGWLAIHFFQNHRATRGPGPAFKVSVFSVSTQLVMSQFLRLNKKYDLRWIFLSCKALLLDLFGFLPLRETAYKNVGCMGAAAAA